MTLRNPSASLQSIVLVPGVPASLPAPGGPVNAGDRAQLAFTAREPFDALEVGTGTEVFPGRTGAGRILGAKVGGTILGRGGFGRIAGRLR